MISEDELKPSIQNWNCYVETLVNGLSKNRQKMVHGNSLSKPLHEIRMQDWEQFHADLTEEIDDKYKNADFLKWNTNQIDTFLHHFEAVIKPRLLEDEELAINCGIEKGANASEWRPFTRNTFKNILIKKNVGIPANMNALAVYMGYRSTNEYFQLKLEESTKASEKVVIKKRSRYDPSDIYEQLENDETTENTKSKKIRVQIIFGSVVSFLSILVLFWEFGERIMDVLEDVTNLKPTACCIIGEVISEEGLKLENAEIRTEDGLLITYTDKNGVFSLNIPENDRKDWYALQASIDGYSIHKFKAAPSSDTLGFALVKNEIEK